MRAMSAAIVANFPTSLVDAGGAVNDERELLVRGDTEAQRVRACANNEALIQHN